ncbi:MAG: YHS domain-containing (seleno)protein [Acidobacteriota bacterium]
MIKNPWPTAALSLLIALTTGCSSEPDAPPVSEQVPEAPAATAAPEPAEVAERPELNLDERGRALRGYDPVAYFAEGKAVAGDPEVQESWNGADYQFTSEANRQAFLEDPERYLPAHGGYCTFGIVLGKKFDGDPEVWLVRDDELHIFLDEEVQGKFLADEAANFARVEANWPGIRDKTARELELAEEPDAGQGP